MRRSLAWWICLACEQSRRTKQELFAPIWTSRSNPFILLFVKDYKPFSEATGSALAHIPRQLLCTQITQYAVRSIHISLSRTPRLYRKGCWYQERCEGKCEDDNRFTLDIEVAESGFALSAFCSKVLRSVGAGDSDTCDSIS